MSGRSVSRGKMRRWIFRSAFLIPLLIHCLAGDESLNYNRMSCGNNYASDCFIEAVFGNGRNNVTVDVLVMCGNLNESFDNQFSLVDKIVWNGCRTSSKLKGFGLRKIARRHEVKYLRVEHFAIGTVEAGTFDGFLGLETLSLRFNSIQNLSSGCFRGLESLKVLEMIDSELLWMEKGVLGDLPHLDALTVDSSHLLIANHQFREHQSVDYVSLEIYNFEAELLEHLVAHVRNLSISVKFDDDGYGCDQTTLNGFEKDWLVESLQLESLRCGFAMSSVGSIKSLSLIRAITRTYAEFELKDLPALEAISLHGNVLQDVSSLGKLDKLKQLDLSDNTLKEIDMRMFEALANLRQMNLSGNFLTKLSQLKPENFLDVQLFVDGNNFDCSWLSDMATANFVYTPNFKNLNMNGLSCQHNPEQNDASCSSYFIDDLQESKQRAEWDLRKLVDDNFILKPEIFMITVSASFLLGAAVTFISIYVHRKRQMLSQKPFYHLLRDSLFRPISNVRDTMRSDFKEIISRTLPPTNYEHPISDSYVTEMSDVAVSESNIYEEIPQKLY